MNNRTVCVIFAFILALSLNSLSAQDCILNCSDHVYLSLDENCEYEVTLDDVLKNPLNCGGAELKLFNEYGELSNPLSGEHRGKKITYKVIDQLGNSCWGTITVEDKWATIIECRDDTLNCWDAEEFINATPDRDNCGYDLRFEEIHRKWVDFNCDSVDFVGYIERSVISTDIWGNTSRCDSQRIYVIREYLDSLICDEELVEIECCATVYDPALGKDVYVLWDSRYVYEDEDGYSHPIPKKGGIVEPPYFDYPEGRHYIGASVNSEGGVNNGKCNIIGEYKDHIIPTCGYTYKIRREWKIFDWCTGRDTSCVQWIKVLDTMAPEIKVKNLDHPYQTICLDGRDFEWYDDCDTVVAVDVSMGREFYVSPHDCKAHVTLTRPEIEKECGFLFAKGDPDKLLNAHQKIKVSYLIRYKDYWSEDHKVKILTGDIPYGETAHVYLPAGWYQVVYTVKDECWNESWAVEKILVHDDIPPTPVCDEITQVTLDPDKCWTRVFAEDLDDGSNDNCAHKLHFAVASMDSIEYYRNYWEEQLLECHDEYDYNHYHKLFDQLIEDWINCYVFNDYIDLSECGSEQLVLRVYEADGLPLYDPHIFKGTVHQWFCYNLYDDYACWYGWNYDKFAHYENPIPDLCDYELVGDHLSHKKVKYYNENCYGPCDHGLEGKEEEGEKEVHGPRPNPVCCEYMYPGSRDYNDWISLVEKYPELYDLHCKRYTFQHLYNDCMIEVLKDDKTPPVCVAPADVSYYCDGVPVVGSLFPNGGNDEIRWLSAKFAHDFCDSSDYFTSYCEFDRTDDGPNVYTVGTGGMDGPWCIEAPWDGGDHGYYGGPSHYTYYEDDYSTCGEDLSAWYPDEHYTWKPIYCRFWLMLDKYDVSEGDGKPNPFDYFGEPEFYDNCWYPEITEVTEGELDECGVGILSRTWTVTDKCGNTSSCYQTITIKPRSDFEVKFPADKEVYCDEQGDLSPVEDDPDSYPIVTDDDCELIGIAYSDQVIDTEEDGCYKILRTWKVIDWCVYVPDIHNRYPDVIVDDRCVADEDKRPCVIRNLKDDGDGYMVYLQVIRVIDDVAPEVTCNNDYEVCIYDENCDAAEVIYDLGIATDNCTEDIQYRYAINPNGNSDESDWIYGHGSTVQNVLPTGVHTAILYARDDCGNESYCELLITVKDCKLPTPYCYNGIATVIMPSTGEVTVWASDLDAGSFDNCTPHDSLKFSFTDINYSPSRTFTCDDIPNGQEAKIQVTIWVKDQAGNQDFCITYILLQDGDGNTCGNPSQVVSEKELSDNFVIEKNEKQILQNGFASSGIYDKIKSNDVFLGQNRPNPFSQETIIDFEISESRVITLQILDISGKIIHKVSGQYSSGFHQWKLDKGLLQNHQGILYYQLISKDKVLTKKMVVLE